MVAFFVVLLIIMFAPSFPTVFNMGKAVFWGLICCVSAGLPALLIGGLVVWRISLM
jgi:hypothetical protein